MNKLEELSIEVTNECNQSCIHCSSRSGSKLNNELSFYEIKDLINQANSLGANVLTLSGGEPLLRNDLFKIIDYAKSLSFEIRLQTSGVYKTGEGFREVSDYDLSNFLEKTDNNDSIIYSVLGLEDEHDRMTRVNGSYELVLNSIKKTKKEDINTKVHTVVHSGNYNQLYNIKSVLEECNVDSWHLLRLVNQGRCNEYEELKLSKNEFKKVQEHFISLKEDEKSMSVELGNNIDRRYWSDNSYPIPECNMGKDKLLIRPNGSVTYCAALKYEGFGSIREESLNYFWNEHDFIKKVRKFLNTGFKKVKGLCETCSILSECKSGCVAQRLYSYNDLMKGPDPLCYRRE